MFNSDGEESTAPEQFLVGGEEEELRAVSVVL